MKEYVNHTDFYSCNKYKQEKNKDLSSDEIKLSKYLFFSDRYKDHLSGVELTTRESRIEIRNFEFLLRSSIQIQPNFVEFYAKAYEVLLGNVFL